MDQPGWGWKSVETVSHGTGYVFRNAGTRCPTFSLCPYVGSCLIFIPSGRVKPKVPSGVINPALLIGNFRPSRRSFPHTDGMVGVGERCVDGRAYVELTEEYERIAVGNGS